MWIQTTVTVLFLLVPVSVFAQVCQKPVTYSIGTIDSRFSMGKKELVEHLQSAENVWEKGVNKDLFLYVDSGGEVTISLTYDSRQEGTIRIKAAQESLARIKTIFEGLKKQLEVFVAESNQVQKTIEGDVARYRLDESTFNTDVQKINARGGATEGERINFAARQAVLESSFAALKAREDAANLKVLELQKLSESLNQLAALLNTFVDRYNVALASIGEFEEGYYKEERGKKSIGIFQFSTTHQLVRVLAHEFGHALGIGHVEDENAIMYRINKGKNLALTSADIQVLPTNCNVSN